ncbi:MAG: FAD-binding protein [Bacteroidaceae bacterium]|nr:FAD-binding protein [Bacteroidaceae bacterium]
MDEKYKAQISSSLNDASIPYEADVLLSKKTWVHRGGNVSFYIKPRNVEELIRAINILKIGNVQEIIVVGHTSNILFSNEKVYEAVISTTACNNWYVEEKRIVCDAGVNMKKLSMYCNENGIDGFYGFIGLPGTIAGAAINNAGCFGCLTSDLVIGVDYYIDNRVVYISRDEMQYGHRSSVLKGNIKGCILRVYLCKKIGDPALLIKKAKDIKAERNKTQEGPANNLGSTYTTIQYKLYVKLLMKIFHLIHLYTKKPFVPLVKKIILPLYGYKSLNRYISDYNIGCFVWRDDSADREFNNYKRFIERISSYSKIEIEEK